MSDCLRYLPTKLSNYMCCLYDVNQVEQLTVDVQKIKLIGEKKLKLKKSYIFVTIDTMYTNKVRLDDIENIPSQRLVESGEFHITESFLIKSIRRISCLVV